MMNGKNTATLGGFSWACAGRASALLFVAFSPAFSQQSNDPLQLLERAERLADLYNWYDAHPLYSQAERLFEGRGDDRNTLFARASRLRGEMQNLAHPDLIGKIDFILATNTAKNDPALRLRCLIVRGDANLEIDAIAAREDWEAALEAAKQAGDRKWQSRATGELGMIAFLLGDATTSRQQVGQALMTAMATSDLGAQIRYYAAIGTGLHLSGEYDQAIRYFDLAINLAAKLPDTGFQYISYWGKAKSLLALNRSQESGQIIREGIRQAERDERRVKKVQMLLAAADLERKLGNRKEATAHLQEALPIAEKGDFKRLLAEICFDLASLLQESGDLSSAGELATRGLRLSEQVGDQFLLPGQLSLVAELRAAEGQPKESLSLLEQATDVVEALLVNAPTAEHASALVRTMSRIYVRHFELASLHVKDVNYAFLVLERARGRVLRDVIAQVSRAS